jgi:DNA-directed RNA polymerase II subunit RPB1
VKHNKVLKSKLSGESKADVIEQLVILLQLDVLQYIDNSQTGVIKARMKANNRPTMHRQPSEGQEGRVRGNLMGKRVNFSARSVITPIPTSQWRNSVCLSRSP